VKQTILFITQVFPPDPASVGQHMQDAAEEVGRRGFRVVVLTADRGYDDPKHKFARRETRGSVEIIRLPFSSLGKQSMLRRMVSSLAFSVQAMWRSLFVRNLQAVLVTTSPPTGAAIGLVVSYIRQVPLKYWLMDLNPDQVVALGLMKPGSVPVRLLAWINRRLFARATDIVVLDKFMLNRVQAYLPATPPRLHTLPPWPLDEVETPLAHEANPFRKTHQLKGRFVVMYSGSHGIHPLDTLLEAAKELQTDREIVFMFIGGGSGKRAVERSGLPNVRSLPYQPRARLRESLSAADLHVVVLSEAVVGINHPCKVYGALAVGRPILFIGPSMSHVGDILKASEVGWHIEHNDVAGVTSAIHQARNMSTDARAQLGKQAQDVVRENFDKQVLQRAFGDVLLLGVS